MRTRRSPRNQHRLWQALGGPQPAPPAQTPLYTSGELYDLAVERMPANEIDSHASNLYLKVTDISRQLVACYKFRTNVTTFTSQIAPHDRWFDIPFAYAPFWRERCK